MFQDLQSDLGVLKQKVKDISNHLSNTNHDESFWWVIYGNYAVVAYILSHENNKQNKVLIKSVLQLNFSTLKTPLIEINQTFIKFSSNEILVKLGSKEKESNKEETEYYQDEKIYNFSKMIRPVRLHFSFLLKLLQKIINQFDVNRVSIENSPNTCNFSLDFDSIFTRIIPIRFLSPTYQKVVKLISYLPKREVTTSLGYNLADTQLIYIAQLYGKKDINVVGHGFSGSVNPLMIWYRDVSSNPINIFYSDIKDASNISKDTIRSSKKILIVAQELEYGFFQNKYADSSIAIYRKVLKNISKKFLCNKDKLSFFIRKKDFPWANSYFVQEEEDFQKDCRDFKSCYGDYDLVIFINTGTTFFESCLLGIDLVAFHDMRGKVKSKQIENFLSDFDGIERTEKDFLKAIDRKILGFVN